MFKTWVGTCFQRNTLGTLSPSSTLRSHHRFWILPVNRSRLDVGPPSRGTDTRVEVWGFVSTKGSSNQCRGTPELGPWFW